MAKFFRFPFATAGDLAAIPDAADPSGNVSYTQGFTADYSRNPATDPLVKRVPRTKTNQVLNDITGALQQYQTHGVPDFISTADNGGAPYSYSKFARVLYTGKIYESLKDANTDLPTVVGSWRQLIIGALAGVYSITAAVTMDRTQANQLGVIEALSGNITSTLPDRSNYIPGEQLQFMNLSAYNAVFNRAGTDTINAIGTSIAVGAGDTLTLIASANPGIWLSTGGSAALQFSQLAFKSTKGDAGNMYRPDSIFEQWGVSAGVNHGASVSVTFPITFPNKCVHVAPMPIGVGVNANPLGLGVAKTAAGATFYNWGGAIDLTNGVVYRALGY